MQTISAQSENLPQTFQKVAPQMNSQGEVIEEIQQEQPQQEQFKQEQPKEQIQQPEVQQAQPQQETLEEDFYELWDTPLAFAADALLPATDDTGLEHKIISWGHVLKSTHDLARWSEKTGARRVNTQESIDAITDLAINLEANTNRGGNRRKTNNNQGQGSDPTSLIQGLFNEGGRGAGGKRRSQQQKWKPVEGSTEKSEVIQCWPVLKSTHDQAQLSEKRGKNSVNKAGASGTLDEVAQNGMQAGGSSLQSGADTQGASHIQMDNKQ